jgi:hypothetical protein
MDESEISKSGAEQHDHEILERSKRALTTAVEIVAGNRDADPLTTFPAPNERRADDAGLELTEEQELSLRQAAAEVGFGREQNLSLSEIGLQGAHVIIEGGQGHKIKAELLSVVEDISSEPKSFTIAVSPNRKPDETEAQITAKVLGFKKDGTTEESPEYDVSMVGSTEYEIGMQVIQQIPGFQALEQGETLPFSYDIDNGFTTGTDLSGQLNLVGHIGEAPVRFLRIDREDYVDEDGQPKYRNQPGTADVITIVDKSIESKDAPLGYITSGTYQGSREVDATRAALTTGRVVGVGTYGTVKLAEVKHEQSPAPAPINQLPGEFHKLSQQVAKLEATIQQQQ